MKPYIKMFVPTRRRPDAGVSRAIGTAAVVAAGGVT
jgi:hypothetical protein